MRSSVHVRRLALAGVYCEGRNKTLLNPFKYFYLSQFHIAVALPFCITLY
jgi:hypothetical protein